MIVPQPDVQCARRPDTLKAGIIRCRRGVVEMKTFDDVMITPDSHGIA